jgi:hypothetical protein
MSPESLITDSRKVVAHFGEWPHFHDMEVVSAAFDRRGPDAPWAEFVVFVWTYTGRLSSMGHYEQHRHALVRFRCERVTENCLEGFNNQNVLDRLNFTAGQGEGAPMRIEFASVYGVGGFIECARVNVIDVVPATSRGDRADEG